jgi:uncharacterized protein Usg
VSIIRLDYTMVTVQVVYFLPDHTHLLNLFVWQTLDLRPQYPRVHRFLDYWRREIDAVIKEIVICDADHLPDWRNGTIL